MWLLWFSVLWFWVSHAEPAASHKHFVQFAKSASSCGFIITKTLMLLLRAKINRFRAAWPAAPEQITKDSIELEFS